MSNATANPFPDLRTQLDAVVFVARGADYQHHLTVIISLYSVSLLVVLVTLGIRIWKSQEIWLVRLQRTQYGTFITPNSTIVWLFWNFVFIVFAVPYCEMSRPGGGPDIMLWRSLLFVILHFGAWSMAWSTALQSILAPTRPLRTYDFARLPLLVNVFFVAIPFLLIGIVAAFGVITSQHYNRAYDTYLVLDRLLVEASAAFDKGSPADFTKLAQMGGLRYVLEGEGQLAIDNWRNVWITSAVFFVLELSVFLASAVSYGKVLMKSLDELRNQRRAGNTFQAQWRQNNVEVSSLAATVLFTVTVICFYLAFDLFLVFKTQMVARDPVVGKYVTLVALYIFAIFGLFCNLVIMLRSIDWGYINTSSNHTTNLSAKNHDTISRTSTRRGSAPTGNSTMELAFSTDYQTEADYSAYNVGLIPVSSAKDQRPFA